MDASSDEDTDDDGVINENPVSINVSQEVPVNEVRFEKLENFLSKPDANVIIEQPLAVSKSEMMLAMIKFAVPYELSTTAIEDLFKMVNSFFPTPICQVRGIWLINCLIAMKTLSFTRFALILIAKNMLKNLIKMIDELSAGHVKL